MAETYTSNLGLVKPDYDSPADISVINSNMDKIDNAVANAGKVKSVNGKTGDVVIDDVSKLNGKSADKYALKDDLPTTAADVGALAENAQAADSAKLGGKAPEAYAQTEDVLTYEEIQASTDLTGKLPSAQALADGVGKIGKLLWAGTFSSGSITVPGVESYSVIAVKAANAVMIGSKNYGIGGNLAYGGIENKTLAYRVALTSENILSITDIDRGCYTSDGTMYPITEIYGVF